MQNLSRTQCVHAKGIVWHLPVASLLFRLLDPRRRLCIKHGRVTGEGVNVASGKSTDKGPGWRSQRPLSGADEFPVGQEECVQPTEVWVKLK